MKFSLIRLKTNLKLLLCVTIYLILEPLETTNRGLVSGLSVTAQQSLLPFYQYERYRGPKFDRNTSKAQATSYQVPTAETVLNLDCIEVVKSRAAFFSRLRAESQLHGLTVAKFHRPDLRITCMCCLVFLKVRSL